MTHIGQGGMVDDWWQSAPGKIAEPPTWRRESGGAGVRLSLAILVPDTLLSSILYNILKVQRNLFCIATQLKGFATQKRK